VSAIERGKHVYVQKPMCHDVAEVRDLTAAAVRKNVITQLGTQLAAGQKGDQTRLVILKCEHDMIGMIGLLEWLDPKLDAPAELTTRLAFGAPIFVVASSDCKAAIERARALGSHIYCEPRDWTVTGADGAEKQMIGGSFFDLDGYFFEVNQQV
jgi:hypothetical protein